LSCDRQNEEFLNMGASRMDTKKPQTRRLHWDQREASVAQFKTFVQTACVRNRKGLD
jgi:hypothetical protein